MAAHGSAACGRAISEVYILTESNVTKSNYSYNVLVWRNVMSELKSFLAENPKMMGAVFTMMLLLSQAGNAVAASGTVEFTGP